MSSPQIPSHFVTLIDAEILEMIVRDRPQVSADFITRMGADLLGIRVLSNE